MLCLIGFTQVHAAPADFDKQVSTHTEPTSEQAQVELQPQKKERPAKSEKKKQAKPQVKKPQTQTARKVPTSTPVDCEVYRPLVSQYGWDVEIALRVMDAESYGGLDGMCYAGASNWADDHIVCMGSFGLFQISCHSGQLYDPVQNVAKAWDKYNNGGWYGHWGVCISGIISCR